MKFSTQHYLINISVQFEDEPNSRRICWVSASSILNFYRILCKYWSMTIFVNQSFCHSKNETSTIIYHSIENFMGYKIMLNCRGKYAAFKNSSVSHFWGTMKNPFNLTLCLSDMDFFFHRTCIIIFRNWQNLSGTTKWGQPKG